MVELARVESARSYAGSSDSATPAAAHAARASGWSARPSRTLRRVGLLRKERFRVPK
jgi:hypothetical protein